MLRDYLDRVWALDLGLCGHGEVPASGLVGGLGEGDYAGHCPWQPMKRRFQAELAKMKSGGGSHFTKANVLIW